jgi:predicted dehydrogenase
MKLVQIGVGKMGRAWLKTITSSDVVELAGIVEPVAAAREWAMNEYRLPPKQCFDSIEKARESLAWDAAVVVTPPPTHRPIAERLLQAGKHVLLEKPMATTMADARALVDIAADTGKMLMVAQNYRSQPSALAPCGR